MGLPRRIRRTPARVPSNSLDARCAATAGVSVAELPWYEALALWRAASFLEGSYRRFLAGTTPDAYLARLETGVPQLGEIARGIAQSSS